jgi:hypothetical protein
VNPVLLQPQEVCSADLARSWRDAADDVWGAWRDCLAAPAGWERALAYECLEGALRIEEMYASRMRTAAAFSR